MKNRVYSLLIPWFMDGSMSLVQTAMPILAIRLGATSMTLGMISLAAQAVRLPICLTSGRISERVGRKKVIVPAACVITLAYGLFAHTNSTTQVMLLYVSALAAIGAFYPSLQAMIGDVSARGQLTKNLGAFNIGWCVGGGVAALAAGVVIGFGLRTSFYVAAVWSVLAGALVVYWKRDRPREVSAEDAAAFAATEDGTLLFISRIGMFTSFFGYTMVRMLFPKLAISSLGWSETGVAWAVAFLPIGQGMGMLITAAAPWWRGKLWPQIGAQSTLLGSGVIVASTSQPVALGAAFFALGFALSVAYTAALYHGLSARRNKGRNAGIHEGIVAAGGIVGSLIGGVAAQGISLRAPYVALACLAAACLVTTGALGRRKMSDESQGTGSPAATGHRCSM